MATLKARAQNGALSSGGRVVGCPVVGSVPWMAGTSVVPNWGWSVAYFRKHPGRFPLLHIKDLKDNPAPTQEFDAKTGLFAPVGSGTIDWKRIFAAAPTGGMKHYYVEQDYCEQPPLEAVKMSYDYLHKLEV